MGRKRLSVKKEKKRINLKKKLETIPSKIGVKDLFSSDFIFASSTVLTDDMSIALILPDSDAFISETDLLYDNIRPFDIDENDLQIEFNRNEPLTIQEIDKDDIYAICPVGIINGKQYNWLKQNYPLCAFYQITKWFGKKVNTLVIVLVEEMGKPVAVVKTIE